MSRREIQIARRTLIGGAAAVAGAALVPHSVRAAGPAPRASARPAVAIPPSFQVMPYLLGTPVRVYDSRAGALFSPNGTDPNTGAGDTPFAKDEVRTIDVSRVLGSETGYTGVDSGSDAVMLNVTVTDTKVAGYVKVWARDNAQPQSSCVNWDRAGVVIANGVVSLHSAGYIKVTIGGAPGCSANLVIDVIGYYVMPG